MALCECVLSLANPLRSWACRKAIAVAPRGCILSVSMRSRCGALRMYLELGRTLCGDRACRSALAVVPCETLLGLGADSRCGAARMCLERGERSAEIVLVEAFSPRRRAKCDARSCRFGCAIATFTYKASVRSALSPPARNLQLLGITVVREEHSRSSGNVVRHHAQHHAQHHVRNHAQLRAQHQATASPYEKLTGEIVKHDA